MERFSLARQQYRSLRHNPSRARGAARTYGAALLVYLLATAMTGPYFWGDSIDYAIELRSNQRLWEFGHLFWRPLGAMLGTVFVPAQFLGADTRVAFVVLFVAVAWLSGLGCVVWLLGLLRHSGIEGTPATVAVLGFILSQTFLNYTQTASSYVPGLAMLLLGCFLLAREATRDERSAWSTFAGSAALAGAVGFWFPYVLALPAALLLPLFLGGFGRPQLRLAVWAGAACVSLIIVCYAVPLSILGIRTADQLRAWVADASHDMMPVRGVDRMLFGLPRSFINMGADGVLFKRYLRHDTLNPISASDLMRLSLWKLGLFYLFMVALAMGLLRSPRGRRRLSLLAVAALPTIGFAVAWEAGSLERYFPLYPFLFAAVGGLLAFERVPLACKITVLSFLIAMAVSNVTVMARPVLWRDQSRLVARVEGLRERLTPNSRVFYVRDEVEGLDRNNPLRPTRDALPLEAAATPGLGATSRWRQKLAGRFLDVWESHGEVWITRRLLAEKPLPEWNWVEGDDPRLSWHDLHVFFSALETDDAIGGKDGFVRVLPCAPNRRWLQDVAKVQ